MYWYQKYPKLYEAEKESYFQFLREYCNPNLKLRFSFDNEKRFTVGGDIPFKASPELPWRLFKFHIVYTHDHPARDAEGYFGGSIRIYPLMKLKPGFHHMIKDSSMGLPYICQVRTTRSYEVTGYNAMKRLCRWLLVYSTWEKTGVDIDM